MAQTELKADVGSVHYLLHQYLDEKVGPVRTDLDGLKNASAEDRQVISRLQAELQEQTKLLQKFLVEASAPRETPAEAKSRRAEEARAAFAKALRGGGIGALNPEERKYVRHESEYNLQSGLNPGHGQLDAKTMYAADLSTGGFLATPEYANEMIESIIQLSDMPALVSVRYTAKPWVMTPKRIQTTSATRISEQATRTETQAPRFGMVQNFPFESYALVLISRTDLDDVELDLAKYVQDDFATQFAKLAGREILLGRGPASNECQGILTDTSITNTALQTQASLTVGYKDLVGLKQSLIAGYRKGASWIWTTETTGAIQMLTDANGNPLWRPFGDELPEKLFGFPYYEMVDMPQIAANNFAVGFGNFKSGYEYLVRKQISTVVLNERYADSNAIGYMGFFRFGGTTKLPEAIKLLKIKP